MSGIINYFTKKAIDINRSDLSSVPTNRIICGDTETGKSCLIRNEIEDILASTKDRIFLVTSELGKNILGDYGSEIGLVKLTNEDIAGHRIVQPKNKRMVIFYLGAVTCKNLPEAYRTCVEAVWNTVRSYVNQENLFWLEIDSAEWLLSSGGGMELLSKIYRNARTHNCTVTLALQDFSHLIGTEVGKSVLFSTSCLTLLSTSPANLEYIYEHYESIINKSFDSHVSKDKTGVLKSGISKEEFINFLCGSLSDCKGIMIVENALLGKNDGRTSALPFSYAGIAGD